jgi:integrase
MARKNFTDIGVAALKPRAGRYTFADPQLVGHYVRVTPNAVRTFVCAARNPAGKQVWVTIGGAGAMPINQARSRAREYLQRIRDGLPAIAPAGASFGDVAGQWLKRHVRKRGLRSEHEVTRLLNTLILPAWADREFLSLRRSDVSALLDAVEDRNGARQADYVLAIVRGIMNWFATRNDAYVPAIVRGMRRTESKKRERERLLSDDEIREVWRAAEAGGSFGALVRILLLTAQRRGAAVRMKWSDLKDGTWTIATEEREKGNAGFLALPPAAIEIIEAQPQFGANPFVFAGRGDGPINGFSKAKAKFDAKLKTVEPWTVHDLRRTARSLMARAGVRSEIAERVMGHAIAGVEGVYNRHAYTDEKAHALAALASLLDGIVHPRDNVAILRKRARRQ